MKATMSSEALLRYHNLPFDIETDASEFHLGAVINQGGYPVAFYRRKLNSAQADYTTIERTLCVKVSFYATRRSYQCFY
jgi:hypothetical protein